jgi:dynactin complex subunit
MRTNIAIKRWELLSLKRARCQWSIPIILATQVTDIRKMVQSQHRQIVHETLSLKKKKKKKKPSQVLFFLFHDSYIL